MYQTRPKRLANWSTKYVQAIVLSTSYIQYAFYYIENIYHDLSMIGNEVEQMKITWSISMIIIKLEMNEKKMIRNLNVF